MNKKECFISWFISEKCNFKCTYCCIEPQDFFSKVKSRLRPQIEFVKSMKRHRSTSIPLIYENIETIIENFKKQECNFTFGFTGGEPFLYPDFVKICERIIEEEGYDIAFDTNLSVSIDKFIDVVPPDRVHYITAAPHIVERERMGLKRKFINNARKLLEKGYPVTFPYIVSPELIPRFPDDYREFKDAGLILVPVPFRGSYEGKPYPESYTEDEFSLFLKYRENPPHVPQSHNRKACNAGMSLIRINKYGDVIRCMDDYTYYGNIYNGFKLAQRAEPCGASICSCYPSDWVLNEPNGWKYRNDLQFGLAETNSEVSVVN